MLISRCLQTSDDTQQLRSEIEKGSNIHFRHGIDPEIYAGDVANAVNRLGRKKAERTLSVASKCSPRVVGRYLDAISKEKNQETRLIEEYCEHSDLDKLAFPHDLLSFESIPERKIEELHNISELGSFSDESKIGFYAYDENRSSQVIELLQNIKGRFGSFFMQQLDLPGVNSLVRHGLVKAFKLPDGSIAVVKKSNPAKPGRLELDLHNAREIHKRICIPGAPWVNIGRTSSNKSIEIEVIRPIAVVADPKTRILYAISDLHGEPTVEEALLRGDDSKTDIMDASRSVLDTLYEKGIIWGDMAPRNILVSVTDTKVRLSLLDFEKARLLDRAVSMEERLEHARGPMCVEEFGAVCDRTEVSKAFAPYFAPSTWSTSSKDPVPFAKPKREIVDILEGRGKVQFNLGEYNATELAVSEIRFPHVGDDGQRRYPTYVNFKIDHYLGANYDRKTTEILMSARDNGVLDQVIDGLSRLLRNIDDGYLRRELATGLSDSTVTTHSYDLLPVSRAVDSLYAVKHDSHGFKNLVRRLDLQTKMLKVRSKHTDQPLNGINTANQLMQLVEPNLVNALKEVSHSIPTDAVVVLAGGAGRGELSLGSDIDMAILGQESNVSNEKSLLIANAVADKTGLDVELYPAASVANLSEVLTSSTPDDLLDYKFGKIASGSVEHVRQFESNVTQLLSEESVLSSIEKWNKKAAENGISDPKIALRTHRINKQIAMLRNAPVEATPEETQYLGLLMFAKNERDVEKQGLLASSIVTKDDVHEAIKFLNVNN